MKTTKEMIEVMQAYERGEQIECSFLDLEDWEDIMPNFTWNWQICDYRVKPKKNYVPFKTADEAICAIKTHGIKVIDSNDRRYDLYVNTEDAILYGFNVKGFIYKNVDFSVLFNDCNFADGTPCGKEVEL